LLIKNLKKYGIQGKICADQSFSWISMAGIMILPAVINGSIAQWNPNGI
jgi:hypothetical protein